MKILQLIPTLNSGGAERITVDICNELVKHHEVSLIQLTGINKENLFYKNQLDSAVSYINCNGIEKKVIELKLVFKLLNIIRTTNPDVVHSHLNIVYSFLPSLFFRKTKFFHTIHNDAPKECLTLKNISFKSFNRFFYKRNLINAITISEESKKSFDNFYGINNSLLVANGCYPKTASKISTTVEQEITTYKKNNETKVFLNIGRFSEQKNQVLLVSVFNRLSIEGENCILLIIGGGFDSEQGMRLQSTANQNIHFLHTKENVGDYLLHSDVFCLSSLWEGLPISLIEAMSTGCYSICTPVGGITNVIENETIGLTSNSCSEDDYYLAIKKYLKSNSLIDKKSIIDHFNRKYNIETTVKKLTTNYY